jgi:hypothetical protein
MDAAGMDACDGNGCAGIDVTGIGYSWLSFRHQPTANALRCRAGKYGSIWKSIWLIVFVVTQDRSPPPKLDDSEAADNPSPPIKKSQAPTTTTTTATAYPSMKQRSEVEPSKLSLNR